MIEAAEYATPTQRKLYEHYAQIHRKFFPSPPAFVARPKLPVEPVAQPEPSPSIPKPKAHYPKIGLEQTGARLKIIKAVVCEEYNISQQALVCERRTTAIVRPRQMYSYLASKFTKASLPMLGRSLGGQDHTTVMAAIRRTKLRIHNDIAIYKQAMRLEARLRQQFGEADMPRDCIGRYVEHERVEQYFLLGWMWAANLNEYAALMIWPCGCLCVEPKYE